jgi:tellurite methyltransferase
MALEDKIRWDKKYKETTTLLRDREASKKLQNLVKDIKGRRALEVACGTGRNSVYLANAGFEVEALDISKVALEILEQKGMKNIQTTLIDLDEYKPQSNRYDLIVKTNYLDREIISNLLEGLKEGGILFIETYMHHESNAKPSSNPAFLLQQGELKTFCKNGYRIIDYDEFDNDPMERYRMRKQSIAIQKVV